MVNVWLCRLGMYTDCVFSQSKSPKHAYCFRNRKVHVTIAAQSINAESWGYFLGMYSVIAQSQQSLICISLCCTALIYSFLHTLTHTPISNLPGALSSSVVAGCDLISWSQACPASLSPHCAASGTHTPWDVPERDTCLITLHFQV